MLSLSGLFKVSTIASTLLASVNAIGNVTRSGRYLYNSDGSRFYIKGVAYQEQGKFIPLLSRSSPSEEYTFDQVLLTPIPPSFRLRASPTLSAVAQTALVTFHSFSSLA